MLDPHVFNLTLTGFISRLRNAQNCVFSILITITFNMFYAYTPNYFILHFI